MCGIVGIIAKSPKKNFNMKHKAMFKQLLHVDTLRGEDSTGIYAVNKYGNVAWAKEATSAPYFVDHASYNKTLEDVCINGMFVVGHNRSATRGSITDENAHPFVEKNIIMVHNGTIRNQKDLHKDAEVDSHAICHAMTEHGVAETLGRIDGAFAIAAYDINKKTLFLARNKERPLWIGEDDDTLVFASEPWMIFGISWRNQLKYKMSEIAANKVLSFNITNLNDEITLTEEEIVEYKRPFGYVDLDESEWWESIGINQKKTNSLIIDPPTKERPALTLAPPVERPLADKIRAMFPKADVKWDNDDIINFTPTGYEKMGEGYRITGQHYQYPEVKVVATDSNMKEAEVKELCKQHILMADISTIVQNSNGGRITLYCAGPCSSTPYVSLNGVIVTEEMVCNMPICKDCQSNIEEDDVETSIVKTTPEGAIKSVFCPTCTTNNVILNPAWCNLDNAAKNIALQNI